MNEANFVERAELFRQTFEKHFHNDKLEKFSFRAAISDEFGSKDVLVKTVQELMKSKLDTVPLAEELLKTVVKNIKSIASASMIKIRNLDSHNQNDYRDFCQIIADALTSTDEPDEVFESVHDRIVKFHYREKKVTDLRATLLHLLCVVLACRAGSKSIFGTVEFFGDVTEFFLEERLFKMKDKNIKQSFLRLTQLVNRLKETMETKWEWNVHNLLDVQSALWMAFHAEQKLTGNVRLTNASLNPISKSKKEFDKKMKKVPTETEKMSIYKRRVGQDILRKNLLKLYRSRCMLTGIDNKELLRVSHIKPWKDCNDNEKLDENNCLLLSALWDAAFDRGLVTFRDDGYPKFSKKLNKSSQKQLTFKTPIVLTDVQRKYLHWHRDKEFIEPHSKS